MQKCFYLICPTDCIEQTINNQFKYENYFYTSLGNSFAINNKTIESIKQTLEKKNIKKIYFVLSMHNKIILDALGEQKFSNITGLNDCYQEVIKQKKQVEVSFHTHNISFSIISYYLNQKINELQIQLSNLLKTPIKIEGKIFNKYQNSFTNIYSDLICLQKHHLN